MPKKFKYRNRSQYSDAFSETARDVIRDGIYMDRSQGYDQPCGIEKQIEQCAEMIATLCETLGLDATIFNDAFDSEEVEKVEPSTRVSPKMRELKERIKAKL